MSDAATLTPTQLVAAGGRSRRAARAGLAVAGAVVAVVALGTRLWELRDVPRLTDETDEVMHGFAIARGEMLPLTNVDAYVGPLWNYLLALAFVLVGPSALLPRLLTAVAALLTVGACVWLGRELAHRLGRPQDANLLGLGAALLLAASSFHAVVSSRIAWSHALTPLAMTVALALLLRWERTRHDRTLVLGGLAFGLAVHTHATALALAPGLGIWALLHWRSILLRPPGWLALGAFLLANLPMLAYNVATGFGSAAAAAQVQQAYAGGASSSGGGYLSNLGTLLASLPLLLAGEVGERRGQAPVLDDPLPYVYAALTFVGLAFAAAKRTLLPLLSIASAALVFPIFNGKYEPLFNGRYLAPLLPLAFALLVLAVTVLLDRLRLSVAPRTVALGVAVVGLTVAPLLALGGYMVATLVSGPNNRELYWAAQIVRDAHPSKPVLVDATLSGTRASTGRNGTGVIEYLLILEGRVDVQDYQPNELAAAVERGEADLVVVSPRLLTRLDKDFITEPPPGELAARRIRRANFVVVRIVGKA